MSDADALLPELKPSWWETGVRARAEAGLGGGFTELPGLVGKAVRVAGRADRARTAVVAASTLVSGAMAAFGLLATQRVLIRLFEGGQGGADTVGGRPALEQPDPNALSSKQHERGHRTADQ